MTIGRSRQWQTVNSDDDEPITTATKPTNTQSQPTTSTSSHAIDMSNFGKHGILHDSDLYRKRVEFELWASEIKSIDASSLSKSQSIKLFREYSEDYNLCLFDSLKYYDYDAFDEEERLNKLKSNRPSALFSSSSSSSSHDDMAIDAHTIRFFDDERNKREEEKEEEMASRRGEMRSLVNHMSRNADLKEDMKRQERLQIQLRTAYKQGDMNTVRKLESILKPDEQR